MVSGNGHSVRVKSSKKTMEGKGFCLIVDPQKLNTATVTRAFGKRKGAQIKIRTILEPREILANHQQLDIPTDEPVKIKMEGKGIFDDLKKKGKKIEILSFLFDMFFQKLKKC